jgi:hypothetical protein
VNYKLETDGERLVYYLQTRVFGTGSNITLPNHFAFTGRLDGLVELFNEIVVVNTACRMILAGRSLQRESAPRNSRALDDASYVSDLKIYLRDTYLIGFDTIDDLTRVVTRCVAASNEHISETQRKRYKKKAEKSRAYCYMCGVELDYTEQDPVRKFTMEHVWPQSFGGNSIEQNLLPACASCNSNKKKNYASWAMVGVQSLMIGIGPTENELKLEGSYQFALHCYAARKLAERKNISLKMAYLRLDNWESPTVLNQADIGDFFNLSNHKTKGLQNA